MAPFYNQLLYIHKQMYKSRDIIPVLEVMIKTMSLGIASFVLLAGTVFCCCGPEKYTSRNIVIGKYVKDGIWNDVKV